MQKVKVNDICWDLPDYGGKVSVPLISVDKKEQFLLDVKRNRIDLKKQKYKTRAMEIVILARLDLGSPHRNPDGTEVGTPHLHLYKEGYNDKWAFPLPIISFKTLTTSGKHYMTLCNIAK